MELSFKEKKVEDKFPITIPYHEMMEIVKKLGGDAYALYVYYHSKGQRWRWRNKNIATDMGWSESKIKRIKSDLKEAGYLYWFTFKGNRYTYIGKLQVELGKKDELAETGNEEHAEEVEEEELPVTIIDDTEEEINLKMPPIKVTTVKAKPIEYDGFNAFD